MEKEKELLQKKRENELEEDLAVLEGYIQAFWEVLPIPVCVVNGSLSIIEAGKAFYNLFGFSSQEVMGRSLEDSFFKDKEDLQKLLSELYKSGKVFDFETILQTKNKQEIFAFVSVVARTDEIGKKQSVGYVFSFVDITSLKKTQQELREKITALEKFEKLAIGRELKMIELKNIIKENKLSEDGK